MVSFPLSPGAVLAHFRWRARMAFLVVFNSLIALVLTIMAGDRFGDSTFGVMLLLSHSIGFTVFAAALGVVQLRKRLGSASRWWDMAWALPAGAIAGSVIGTALTGSLGLPAPEGIRALGENALLGVIFGAAAAYYFFSRGRIAQGEIDARQQEMQLAETRLRLLQAQIEPHFLFNTLSNIHGLIETHPARAARMLEALTQLLRASLKRTREGETSLGEELALVRAYLAIQQERMGERLAARVDVPDELSALPFPPLLIQPLVENAVLHGIEPLVQGGSVRVAAQAGDGRLEIEVSDTGQGLADGAGGQGVGLTNVRERIASLYGNAGELRLVSGEQGGVTARLSLPLSKGGRR